MPRKKAGAPQKTTEPPKTTGTPAASAQSAAPTHGSTSAFSRLAEGERFLARVDDILPNPRNIREEWEWAQDPEFDEFVANIDKMGVLQDPVVMEREAFASAFPADAAKLPDDGKYVLAMGERRWRAARRVGMPEMPVVLKNESVKTMDEILWSENQSRKGLNPLQEGTLFKRFRDDQELELEAIAAKLGSSKGKKLSIASISKKIRLVEDFPDGPARRAIQEQNLGVEPAYILLTKLREAAAIDQAWQQMQERGITAKAVVAELTAPSPSPATPSASTEDSGDEDATTSPDTETAALDSNTSGSSSIPPQTTGESREAQPKSRVISSTKTDTAGEEQAQQRAKACTALLEGRTYGEPDELVERLAAGVLRFADAQTRTLGGTFISADLDGQLTGSALVRAADAVLLALAELKARDGAWDESDCAYVQSLADSAGYAPSETETAQLESISQAQA